MLCVPLYHTCCGFDAREQGPMFVSIPVTLSKVMKSVGKSGENRCFSFGTMSQCVCLVEMENQLYNGAG